MIEEKKKQDPQAIWKDYENGKNYKSGENLYNIIARNERFYAGDQFKGIKDNILNPVTLNFLEQLVDVKVSTIMANQITIHRRPDELSEKNPIVEKAAKVFQESDKKNWERLKMDSMNEEGLLDAALSGLLVSYWYWDEDLISGNGFKIKGDFCGELIDSINLYVSNPNETDIQKQDWLILSFRKSVKQVKELAKKYGKSDVEIEMIKGDEDFVYEGFDKAQNEQDSSKHQNTTMLLKLWKDTGTKKIMFCKAVKELTIVEETTELSRYPVAIMPWKLRKRFIYGNAEITNIISNQQHVNKLESMRQLNAQLFAIPKVGFNKNMISGITNQVGAVHPVNAEPGTDISKAIHYWQPTQMTLDVDKAIESTITKTREFKGINENVIGAEKPDNYSAILAQQRAAGVPLETIKRRFYQYIEDVALIWLDFYKNKYKLTRRIVVEDEENLDPNGEPIKEAMDFTGIDYADIDLKTAIDVGASTQYSEIISMQVLDNLLDKQRIDILQYLERYPKNIIPQQQKLIDELKQRMQQQMEMQQQAMQQQQDMAMQGQMIQQQSQDQQFEKMAQWLQQQPKEVQQKIMQLPEEEQPKVIMQLMNQSVRNSMPKGAA